MFIGDELELVLAWYFQSLLFSTRTPYWPLGTSENLPLGLCMRAGTTSEPADSPSFVFKYPDGLF